MDWEISIGRSLATLYKPLISPGSSIEAMAELVLAQSRKLTGSAHGFVASVDRADGTNCVQTCTSVLNRELPASARKCGLFLERRDGAYVGLRGHSLNTKEAFYTNSATTHSAFRGYPKWHAPVRRFLSVPVILDGRPAGQIALANPAGDYSERDLKAVKRLAGFYALALQRRRAEEQTEAALREKEVLLREIHHRVKNNLQVISSLLNLQAGSLQDPDALEMLKESQNRVRSMAMVHEQLHRSTDLSRINFAEYIRNLTASLFCSYGIDSSAIRLNLQTSEACLPIDAAVPGGLIIQELVSNSIKHAFPGGREGEIAIGLQPMDQRDQRPGGGVSTLWRLTVSDNGVGLPADLDPETNSSLGLRLVRILAEQLSGSVTCISDSGTEFRIDFETQ